MCEWVGYAVSINCGETLGSYQGIVMKTDGATITLRKAFRNGFPYPKSQVTLNAADIMELRIIKAPSEGAETHSTVAASTGTGASTGAGAGTGGRKERTTVCETLQSNPTNTGNQSGSSVVHSNKTPAGHGRTHQAPQRARTNPVEVQLLPPTNNNNTHTGSSGNSGSMPRNRGGGVGGGGGGAGHEMARRRNEACFGEAAEPAHHDDFDFEGNLALFDKSAVWATMRNTKPDVVRAADEKYRHDENVLGGGGAGGGGCGGGVALHVPADLRGPVEYVTDEGVVVPTVTPALRKRLWEELHRHGLAEFAYAMVSRAAVDVALRLVGGGRRLEARNAHQPPRVVAVCGAHDGGACGIAAARLLASRGCRASALVVGAAGSGGEESAALRRELAAAALAGLPLHVSTEALGGAPPDLVVVAVYDPARDPPMEQYAAACRWVEASRAAALCVEPAGGGWAAAGARACLLAGAAVALPPALGRIYLADVAPPRALLRDLRLRYRPPYGAAPVLALHPRDT